MEHVELKAHLQSTKDRFDVTEIYDRSGYSPLHFAAYKNSDKICEILCDFVLDQGSPEETESAVDQERRQKLKNWVNTHSRGDEGFTALHFASFHGNMVLVRMLVGYGANVFAKNK